MHPNNSQQTPAGGNREFPFFGSTMSKEDEQTKTSGLDYPKLVMHSQSLTVYGSLNSAVSKDQDLQQRC